MLLLFRYKKYLGYQRIIPSSSCGPPPHKELGGYFYIKNNQPFNYHILD